MNRVERAQAPPSLHSISHETASDPPNSIVILDGHVNLWVSPETVDSLLLLRV